MAEDLNGGGGEDALLCFDEQPVLQQVLEYQADVAGVLRRGLGEDQDVVQVDHDEDVEEIPQHVINQGLENSWSVSQPERHDEVLKVTQVSVKPRLPFVPLSDPYQMVCVAQVELREHRGVGERLEHGAKQR